MFIYNPFFVISDDLLSQIIIYSVIITRDFKPSCYHLRIFVIQREHSFRSRFILFLFFKFH